MHKKHAVTRNDNMGISVKGHLTIKDDLGNVLVDKDNAIHPQNMARILSRALSNEDNSWIHRIAFGNGGTLTDAAFQITYRTPNDGQLPDTAGWASTLYNETYSEIIDDSNPNVTIGTGSASGDPASVEHVSGPGVRSVENGLTSQVAIEAVLNPNEPTGQAATDNLTPTESTDNTFTFDEIGLFTPGLPSSPTAGYQNVNVSDKNVDSFTGLAPSTEYTFAITVDSGTKQEISITTAGVGSGPSGEHTYADLLTEINGAISSATASINDEDSGINTFGFLKFTSDSTGITSTILLEEGATGTYLFTSLTGFVSLESAVDGQAAGVQNDPVNSETERERMLTHVIFSPVLKSANRTLIINYTLTIAVARSINPEL